MGLVPQCAWRPGAGDRIPRHGPQSLLRPGWAGVEMSQTVSRCTRLPDAPSGAIAFARGAWHDGVLPRHPGRSWHHGIPSTNHDQGSPRTTEKQAGPRRAQRGTVFSVSLRVLRSSSVLNAFLRSAGKPSAIGAPPRHRHAASCDRRAAAAIRNCRAPPEWRNLPPSPPPLRPHPAGGFLHRARRPILSCIRPHTDRAATTPRLSPWMRNCLATRFLRQA